MKLKTLLHAFALVAIALFLAGAKEAPPKPVLKIDPSPVADGKSGLVTSYASVVEPVQQAVVSVYSAKIVRQYLSPYFRQFFGD